MKEQEIRNDKSPIYTFKSKFLLGYELLRNSEQIGVAIFTIILVLSVDLRLWKYTVIGACLFVMYEICYLLYLKGSISRVTCTLYRTKMEISKGLLRKRLKKFHILKLKKFHINKAI